MHSFYYKEIVMLVPALNTLISFSNSCNAVNDLFRGRNLDNVVNKLAELWEILFRVRDDIKVQN